MLFTCMVNGCQELPRWLLLLLNRRKCHRAAQTMIFMTVDRFLSANRTKGAPWIRRRLRTALTRLFAGSQRITFSLLALQEARSVASTRILHVWVHVSVLVRLQQVIACRPHSWLAFEGSRCRLRIAINSGNIYLFIFRVFLVCRWASLADRKGTFLLF